MFIVGLSLLFFLPQSGGAAEPIKMLDLNPQTGVMKDVGDRYQLSVKFWEEEVNKAGGILGRPVKVFYDDHQTKPDVATRKAVRYISEEKIEFMMTGVGTHIANAMADVADKNKVIFLNYAPAGDALTGKDFRRHHFRVSLQNSQQAGALAAYFAASPYKKYYILCQDYAFGHDVAEAFKKGMKKMGASWQLVGEDYHPIGQKDFGPYISKIISSGAEVLITGNFVPDLLVLLKQGASLGLKAKIGSYYMEDPYILQAVGDAAIGALTVEIYALTTDTTQNKAYVDRWHKRKMDPNLPYPDFIIGKSYQAMKFMEEAIKSANSTKAEDVIKAWEGLTTEGLIGKMTMRACDHQVIAPVCVSEVMPGSNPYYKFPYIGKPTIIPAEKAALPQDEVDNPRCKK